MTQQHRNDDLTWPEVEDAVQNGDVECVILTTGATEQHRRHLALGFDWRAAEYFAGRVAERLSPKVLVCSPLRVGISGHHLDRAGTLSLSPGTFYNVLADTIASIVSWGVDRIVILNGHGGNVEPLKAGLYQLRLAHRDEAEIHFLSHWDVLREAEAQLLESGQEMPRHLPGHAEEFETSEAMVICPETVREELRKDDEEARHATLEKGSTFVETTVNRLSERVRLIAEGEITAEKPDFHR